MNKKIDLSTLIQLLGISLAKAHMQFRDTIHPISQTIYMKDKDQQFLVLRKEVNTLHFQRSTKTRQLKTKSIWLVVFETMIIINGYIEMPVAAHKFIKSKDQTSFYKTFRKQFQNKAI
jgi:hypothetical protein